MECQHRRHRRRRDPGDAAAPRRRVGAVVRHRDAQGGDRCRVEACHVSVRRPAEGRQGQGSAERHHLRRRRPDRAWRRVHRRGRHERRPGDPGRAGVAGGRQRGSSRFFSGGNHDSSHPLHARRRRGCCCSRRGTRIDVLRAGRGAAGERVAQPLRDDQELGHPPCRANVGVHGGRGHRPGRAKRVGLRLVRRQLVRRVDGRSDSEVRSVRQAREELRRRHG